MKTKQAKNGFTLLEMLIVLAIIGVLVAIFTPTFASKLEIAREAADAANIRTAMSQTNANYLLGEKTGLSQTINIMQTQTGWQNGLTEIGGCEINKNSALQMKDLTNIDAIKVSCLNGRFTFEAYKK